MTVGLASPIRSPDVLLSNLLRKSDPRAFGAMMCSGCGMMPSMTLLVPAWQSGIFEPEKSTRGDITLTLAR